MQCDRGLQGLRGELQQMLQRGRRPCPQTNAFVLLSHTQREQASHCLSTGIFYHSRFLFGSIGGAGTWLYVMRRAGLVALLKVALKAKAVAQARRVAQGWSVWLGQGALRGSCWAAANRMGIINSWADRAMSSIWDRHEPGTLKPTCPWKPFPGAMVVRHWTCDVRV